VSSYRNKVNWVWRLTLLSSSPLNGQAAELWDKDMKEYQRLVLARHKAPEELDV
jgi:ubiquitin-protein ligase